MPAETPPSADPEAPDGPGHRAHTDAVHRSMAAVSTHVQHARPVTVARRRYEKSAARALLDRLKDLQLGTTMTVFGASFLLSALPFMILLSSFANRHVEDDLASHLGLNAQATAILDRLFDRTPTRSAGPVALAVLFTSIGTVGIAGIVRSVYRQIFGTASGSGDLWRLLVWTGGLLAWLAVDSVVSGATHHVPAGVLLDGFVTLIVSTAFFWWSMHFLLAGQLPWRRLLLPAVLSAVLWLCLEVFAALYFSSTIASDSRLYGTVGVVFSLLTWFMAVALVVVLGALIGQMWQERHPRARD